MELRIYEVNSLNHELLVKLSEPQIGPCLSLYQPTHRQHPENQQDSLRFRGLVKRLEESLLKQYSSDDIHRLLIPFDKIAEDSHLWNHTLDGLAVFSSSQETHVITAQYGFPEIAIVADSFHTKHLRRVLQTGDRYHILALNRKQARLFEGNRQAIDEVQIKENIPVTVEEAVGSEHDESYLTFGSYGGGGPGVTPMYHGHGGKSDKIDIDTERFFRVIDRAIWSNYSSIAKIPLILATLPEHHHVFHQISHNPHLVTDGIKAHPDSLKHEEFKDLAWKVMEPHYQSQLNTLVEEFQQAKSKNLGSDEFVTVAKAAASGRVGKLLVEAERQIAGKLDPETGRIEFGELLDPFVDDLLDDLADLVEKKKGMTLVLPKDQMPTTTGLAAVYRY